MKRSSAWVAVSGVEFNNDLARIHRRSWAIGGS